MTSDDDEILYCRVYIVLSDFINEYRIIIVKDGTNLL